MSTQAAPPLRPQSLAALTACQVMGLVSPWLLPLLVPAMIKSYAISAATAGLMVSTEMVALALSGFLAALFVQRVDRRMAAAAALAVILCGNLVCLLGFGLTTLVVGRALVGLGEGALVAITVAAASGGAVPERIFAVFSVAIGLTGAVMLHLLPGLIARFGADGVFGSMVVLALCAAPTLIWFPAKGATARPGVQIGSLFSLGPKAAMTLSAAAVYSIGYGAATSYLALMGRKIGAGAGDIGNMLATGAALTTVVSLGVVAIGGRFGRFWPMLAGGVLLTALAGVAGSTTLLPLYFAAGVLFSPTVLFLAPYQYGVMAKLDPLGRIGAAAPTCIKIGFAIGAYIGGRIFDAAGRQPLAAFSAVWIALGMGLYCLMAARADRMIAAPVETAASAA